MTMSELFDKFIKVKKKRLEATSIAHITGRSPTAIAARTQAGTLSSQPWFYPAVAFAAYDRSQRSMVVAPERLSRRSNGGPELR